MSSQTAAKWLWTGHISRYRVKIVTDETPGTAREIARRIGAWKAEDTDRNLITGPAFKALTDEEALERIPGLKIMCRARPMDKQRLVNRL